MEVRADVVTAGCTALARLPAGDDGAGRVLAPLAEWHEVAVDDELFEPITEERAAVSRAQDDAAQEAAASAPEGPTAEEHGGEAPRAMRQPKDPTLRGRSGAQ